MTKPGVNPEKLPTDVGEAVDQEITLETFNFLKIGRFLLS